MIEYAIKANRVQAEKFNIQIEVEYPEDKIGKLFVDSEKIAWVLTNLLSNAIRYSPENGRVVIGARQTDDGLIEMFVRDFGKGIKSIIPINLIMLLLLVHAVYIGIRCYVKNWREKRGYF